MNEPTGDDRCMRPRTPGGSNQVMDSRASAPDQRALDQELDEAVAAGLAALPPLQRAALELKSLGHSQEEVGTMLEISPTYAGVLIHRARQALAAHLAAYTGEGVL